MKYDPEGDTAATLPANSRQMIFDLSGLRCFHMGGQFLIEIPDGVVLEIANQSAVALAGSPGKAEIVNEEKFLAAVLHEFSGPQIETESGRLESRMGAAISAAIRAVIDKSDNSCWRRST